MEPPADAPASRALRARITGRVQGVSFRAWTAREAARLGLTGWVRNMPDGSVSALLCGPAPEVDQMLEALHRGPPFARVSAVTTEPATESPPAGFTIRP